MREADKRIDRLFQLAAKDSPDRVHLLLGKNEVATYADTYQRALEMAAVLVHGGVRRGDHVACIMENCRELVEFYIACSLCGAVSVALNTMSRPREVQRILADCTPTAVVVQPEFKALFADMTMPTSMRLKVVTGTTSDDDWVVCESQMMTLEPFQPLDDLAPAEPAVLIYSSGTTGLPKGIVLSHQGVIDNALCTTQVLEYRRDDRLLTLLPMFSSFGFAFDLIHVTLARASVVIMERFNEQRALDLIERHKVTFLAGVPTMFSRMFTPSNIRSRDLSSIRMIDVGGGPVSLRLKQMMKEEVGTLVVESYGLTEISPVASVQRVTDEVRTSSCGAPLPSFEVRVVDATGNDVAQGEAGELLFRSNTFMLGYLNQPELTAETLRNGWLHSGDVGRVDENGEIHILDRTKDMIVTNGYNVFPKEIENVIAELAEVQEVAVVGMPDEIRGELVHAFVVPKPGMTLTEHRVIDYVSEHLARFKVPRSVLLLKELPLTATGKIQRFRLRQQLEATAQREKS